MIGKRIEKRGKPPEHVAIIMDGNGRWAGKKFLPRVFGHRAGAETVRKIVRSAAENGLKFLTLYAFSSENWKRGDEEVGFLFNLFLSYMRKETAYLKKENVRVRFIGRLKDLPAEVQSEMEKTIHETEGNTGLTLILAVNYGARNELTDAFITLFEKKTGAEITPEDIDGALQTAPYPNPDLIIRTAGERRLSNFLLWQAAYSELYFTDALWPDFDEKEFLAALSDYSGRERKYGAITE